MRLFLHGHLIEAGDAADRGPLQGAVVLVARGESLGKALHLLGEHAEASKHEVGRVHGAHALEGEDHLPGLARVGVCLEAAVAVEGVEPALQLRALLGRQALGLLLEGRAHQGLVHLVVEGAHGHGGPGGIVGGRRLGGARLQMQLVAVVLVKQVGFELGDEDGLACDGVVGEDAAHHGLGVGLVVDVQHLDVVSGHDLHVVGGVLLLDDEEVLHLLEVEDLVGVEADGHERHAVAGDLVVERRGVCMDLHVMVRLVVGIEADGHVGDVGEKHAAEAVDDGQLHVMGLEADLLTGGDVVEERHGYYMLIHKQSPFFLKWTAGRGQRPRAEGRGGHQLFLIAALNKAKIYP